MDVVNRTTLASPLKVSLDHSAARIRAIADRVARASGADAFVLPAGVGNAGTEPVDLEAEMTRLADEQLRYDAAAKLLQKAYATLRTAMRDR